MGRKVKNYFSSVAKQYDHKSRVGFWQKIREIELNTFNSSFKNNKNISVVLDLGCGAGFYSLFLRDNYNLDIYSIDFCPEMLANLQDQNLKTIEADLENIKIEQIPSFDIALAMGSLEFIENLDNLILNLSLKSHMNSKIFILVPRDGVVGFIYEKVHLLWGCPVIKRSAINYVNLFKKYSFSLVGQENAGIVSQLLIFEKKASEKIN